MQDILKQIKDSWFLLVFIGSIVATWTSFQLRISEVEAKIIALETKVIATDASVNSIKESLASISTKLDFIIKER